MSFLKIGNRKSYSNITVYYLLGTTRKKYNYCTSRRMFVETGFMKRL